MHKLMREHPEREAARAEKISIGRKNWNAANPEKAEWIVSRMLASRTPENAPLRAAKARAKLIEMKWKPQVRGGNGTGPTKAESQIMEWFPDASWNFPVKTKKKRGTGYPTNYKVDVAFVDLKLAIEADGASHLLAARKGKDAKKDSLLKELGWTVLRLKNSQILDHGETTKQIIESTICMLRGIQVIA